MLVDYLHPVHGWWAQYAGAMAGHYPGLSRALRRQAELAAHRDGARVCPALLREPAGALCGAPGLLGGAPTMGALALRRRQSYGPGRLP